MSWPHLHLAVVGHTNTGKTSLVRTLLRHSRFGEVRDQGGTTQTVLGAPLYINNQPAMTLYDSPGLENAPGVFDWLNEHAGGLRHQGMDRIRVLLDDAQGKAKFRQEATVLELVIQADLAIYVVDAREPVLEKYQDELSLLAGCATPMIVVLNFVASPHNQASQWREALAVLGQHHVVAFDAMVRNPATEQRLFEKARSLLDRHVTTIDAWLEQRAIEEAQRLAGSLRAIARLLMDIADRQWTVSREGDIHAVTEALKSEVREREEACVALLLDIYRFERTDYDEIPLSLDAGRWQHDLFDPEALKAFGIQAGRYVGTGAGVGALFDVATGGLSLGSGTLTGALVGGGLSVLTQFGHEAVSRLRGEITLRVDEPTLRLLVWRQMSLLKALRVRGHATQKPLSLPAQAQWEAQALPKALTKRGWGDDKRIREIIDTLALAFVED